MRTLLIGGARSGKSALAQRWAEAHGTQVCLLVTGRDSDPEMAARIEAHRRNRPAHWRVREEPVHLGRALRKETGLATGHTEVAGEAAAKPGSTPRVLLIDCLTLWISNCLWSSDSMEVDYETWHRERTDFLTVLSKARQSDIYIVSNEVGTGIVPDNAAARAFRDEQGWVNQAVAAVCDQVFFVTAGLPLSLKPSPPAPAHTTTLPR